MTVTINGTTGITTPAVTNEGAYTGDGVVFADSTPSNTLVTTTGGNVGIGTSSPAYKLQVNGGTATRISADTTSGTYYNRLVASQTFAYSGIEYSTLFNFVDGATERMRIDSSGNLLVGTTSTATSFASKSSFVATGSSVSMVLVSDNLDYQPLCVWNKATTGTRYLIDFSAGTSYSGKGNITTNGTSVSYNTTSDYRLKENVAPMTGALATVAQLKPVTYTWKHDGSASQGFIAHELQEVVPDAVVGEKDAVNEDGSIKPQGIDTSFLVATLTAAIQEQTAIITDLKSRIEALEQA